jgi:hypothetical protein
MYIDVKRMNIATRKHFTALTVIERNVNTMSEAVKIISGYDCFVCASLCQAPFLVRVEETARNQARPHKIVHRGEAYFREGGIVCRTATLARKPPSQSIPPQPPQLPSLMFQRPPHLTTILPLPLLLPFIPLLLQRVFKNVFIERWLTKT